MSNGSVMIHGAIKTAQTFQVTLYSVLGMVVTDGRTVSVPLWSLVLSWLLLFWSPSQSRVSGGAGGEWQASLSPRREIWSVRLSSQNPIETLAPQVHANEDRGINTLATLRHTHTHTLYGCLSVLVRTFHFSPHSHAWRIVVKPRLHC